MDFNNVYISTNLNESVKSLLKEHNLEALYEDYETVGFEVFNEEIQLSQLDEGFKDKLKKLGKAAILAGAIGAGSAGLASCSNPAQFDLEPPTAIEQTTDNEQSDISVKTSENSPFTDAIKNFLKSKSGSDLKDALEYLDEEESDISASRAAATNINRDKVKKHATQKDEIETIDSDDNDIDVTIEAKDFDGPSISSISSKSQLENFAERLGDKEAEIEIVDLSSIDDLAEYADDYLGFKCTADYGYSIFLLVECESNDNGSSSRAASTSSMDLKAKVKQKVNTTDDEGRVEVVSDNVVTVTIDSTNVQLIVNNLETVSNVPLDIDTSYSSFGILTAK